MTGDVIYAVSSCKAGQGGCCKHVGGLLFKVLDFVNAGEKEISRDLTCNEVGQIWNKLACSKLASSKAFNELMFEKAEPNKERKRPLVCGKREFCATPKFALKTTNEELENLAKKLKASNKAHLFCEMLKSLCAL